MKFNSFLACFVGATVCALPVLAQDRKPLDELVMTQPLVAIADVADADLPRVCNTQMMISTSLMEDVGRPDLGNVSDYPMVTVNAAVIEADGCRIEVNFQKYTPPGVTVSCLIKEIEFNTEMQRAVATSYSGATCE